MEHSLEVLFESVFQEAHRSNSHHHSFHHSSHHNSRVLPKFNSKGDWYHDGICTHFDGIKMEDLYVQPNGKKLTCGFLIVDDNTKKYLGCHPTGQKHNVYDIPKGCRGLDGTDLENAIRELEEETGIKLTGNESIEDIGIFEHNLEKDIHLFKVCIPVDLDTLHCDSNFKDFNTGKIKPECDDFVLLDDISHFHYCLQSTLKSAI